VDGIIATKQDRCRGDETMLKKLLLGFAAVGLLATGCSGDDPVDAGSADAQLGVFAKKQAGALKPALQQYRKSHKAALARKNLKECNQDLEWGNTDCFSALLKDVHESVATLQDKTPSPKNLNQDCRAGLQRWNKVVARYEGFSEQLYRDFDSDNFNRISNAMEKYSLLLDYDELLQDKGLAALQSQCIAPGSVQLT
jgi:hypothetical protein